MPKIIISKEEVQHIAKLARLGLTEEEIRKFQKDLSSILDYIEKLKGADISKTEPTSHPVRVENIIREDKARFRDKPADEEKLLELMPEKNDRYLKVKSIL